jgi:hypothetical protein
MDGLVFGWSPTILMHLTRINATRNILCWIWIMMMIAFVPASLMATDSGAGMVRPYGTAWLNGTPVAQSSTIFPGDFVQTSSASALNIQTPGSSVMVVSDSVVKFEGDAVQVDHGGVKLMTSKGMFARAGMVSATPASTAWTEFKLTHENGEILIVALKGDLQISDGTQTTTLPQGQQATQQDSDSAQTTPDKAGAVPPAKKKKKKAAFILLGAGAAGAGVAAFAVANASSGTPRVISPITP